MDLLLSNVFSVNIHLHKHRPHIQSDSHIGYIRADGRWITQYNSLFIVLNNIGQVIAWQFTRTTSIDECEDLLFALKDRCTRLGQPVMEVYVDNCCQSRNKLQLIFGQDTRVCLDIFHAAQRITKTIYQNAILFANQ